ncbi:hypothetical protein GCK72_021195 [Caenorhabditis remanei]|uniref:C6 domain-containing protein n=1 Tax=Caenorhabditis remanei TaxID=31234 RepID=A0A6A5GJF7_CAERE|nr:hypothetical protein GCK72_021195 [Caenorhabditis remanei]KAF1754632.1 hypothetical protein GCK72_021195 [Caenorhabditis remanei]
MLIPLAILFSQVSGIFYPVEACLATSPSQAVTVTSTETPTTSATASSTTASTTSSTTSASTTSATTTEAPPVLRTCSPTAITYGAGDNLNPQLSIKVDYTGLTSTQIGDTADTTSTMTVTCSAIDGYSAYMLLDGNTPPAENQGNPQTVSITAVCSSVDMIWNYVVEVNGQTFTRAFTSVNCNQAP